MDSKTGYYNEGILLYNDMNRVNVDIDVPLFLPLSGQRRLYDLRRTARLESQELHITGQMNFESGWEYGYYLSNLVTARASWDPHMEIGDDWLAFRTILNPVLRVFGDYASDIENAIVTLSKVQADILIYGRVGGKESIDLTKLSGHAYMSGSDTWVDVPRLLGLSFTQPDKIHLDEIDDPQWEDMMSLLQEMDRVFAISSKEFSNIYTESSGLMDEV